MKENNLTTEQKTTEKENPFIVSESESTFEILDSGNYCGKLIRLIDLGTHAEEFNGKEKQTKKIRIEFEIEEKRKNGAPFIFGKDFTSSLDKKSNLFKFISAWRGVPFTAEELKGFDLRNILGAHGLVNIGQTTNADGSRTYNIIAGVSSVPKNMTKYEPENEIKEYYVSKITAEELKELAPFIASKILESNEAKERSDFETLKTEYENLKNDKDSDLPF